MKFRNISQYICLVVHSILYRIKVKPQKHYNVVIVRSDAIGDFVMWISTLPYYKKKYQGKSVLLICPKPDKELAKAMSFFKEILVFDRNKIDNRVIYHAKFMHNLKRISSDVVINPTWQHHSSADYICAMIKSPQKIGTNIKRNGIRAKWCDKYFTKLVEMPDLHNASEFDAIECFTQKVIDVSFRYTLSDLSNITKGYTSPILGKYCCISISSSIERKNWPVERVSEVLRNVPMEYQIVLLGYGENDTKKADAIICNDQGKHMIHNYVNKTSVIDMIKMISKSTFVLGNDSVAVHIAAACRILSICYTHGAHFNRFVPYPSFIPEQKFHPRCVYYKMDCFGCDYRCKYDKSIDKPLLCLRNVSTEMVIKELKKLIKELDN